MRSPHFYKWWEYVTKIEGEPAYLNQIVSEKGNEKKGKVGYYIGIKKE